MDTIHGRDVIAGHVIIRHGKRQIDTHYDVVVYAHQPTFPAVVVDVKVRRYWPYDHTRQQGKLEVEYFGVDAPLSVVVADLANLQDSPA